MAQRDVHVWLSHEMNNDLNNPNGFEIVIGGNGDKTSYIRYGMQAEAGVTANVSTYLCGDVPQI